jgi:hypothetical protein
MFIQGVLKMAHDIYVMRVYVEYQTKNCNANHSSLVAML